MNKIDGYVYFKHGWEKFVQDNSLEFGDFLIFYYNGGPQFYVTIFSKNNCPKEIEATIEKSEKQPIYIQEDEANTTGKLAETSF